MAGSSTGRKTSAGRTKKTTTNAKKTQTKRKKKASGNWMQQEVRRWVIFLLLLLVTLGVYLQSSMGIAGIWLSTLFLGLFGFSAYVITLFSLLLAGFQLFSKMQARTWKRVAACYGEMIVLSAFLHVLNGSNLTTYKAMYSQASIRTGGIVGGCLGQGLTEVFGKTGAIVVLVFLFLIGAILITERSFVKGMTQAAEKTKETTMKVHQYTADKTAQYTQRRQEKKELENLRQEEKKAWSNEEAAPRLDLEAPTAEGDRQIIIHGLKPDPEAEARADGRKVSPVGRKKPIADGTVDIPLVSSEAYMSRKKRFEARQQQSAQQEQAEVSPAVVPEEVAELEAAEAVKEQPEATGMACQETKPLLEEVDLEALSQEISTEKAFANEEFPTGYPEEEATEEASKTKKAPKKPGPSGRYQPPSVELLKPGSGESIGGTKAELLRSAKVLEDALLSFGVEAKVVQVNRGPAVTRFELQPKQGVKVSRIVNLTDDIAMNLAAPSIRIEAPIPGKSAVGIEVPNKEISMVTLRDVIDSETFRKAPSKLTFSLGKDIDGEVRVADIAKMPHLLIAGATGSGKSVCINSLIISLIYKADPNEVKLILIDPKVVELSVYNGIPHLLLPVVNDPKKAAATLNWAVQEMTRRYKKFADLNVRDIRGYNEAVQDLGEEEPKMPQIVIIIDELADLMMVASKEVEASICRIAQMARAAGMHLVIATQRPSVDVITGLIKANIPSRLAFAVSSGVDSRTILDNVGAEKLLGRGDMLFSPIGASKPVRIQGAFVSDKEVEAVVESVRLQGLSYDHELMDTLQREDTAGGNGIEEEIDEYLEEAIRFVVEKQRASISMLQRAFRIGFNRAARLMDALYARGVVGPDEGSKPRKVLMTQEEWENDEFSH